MVNYQSQLDESLTYCEESLNQIGMNFVMSRPRCNQSMTRRPKDEECNAYSTVQFIRAKRLELEKGLEALLALEALTVKQDALAQSPMASNLVNMPLVDCVTWPSSTLIGDEADCSGVPSETLQAVTSSYSCSSGKFLVEALASSRSCFPEDFFVDPASAATQPAQETCSPLDTVQVQFSGTFSESISSSSNEHVTSDGLVELILPVRKRLRPTCPMCCHGFKQSLTIFFNVDFLSYSGP
jgi:hypothetical protein